MADIQARREARVRKILENSEKRLNRITGVENKSPVNVLDGFNAKHETTPSSTTTTASEIREIRSNNFPISNNQNHVQENHIVASTPKSFFEVFTSFIFNYDLYFINLFTLIGIAALFSLVLILQLESNIHGSTDTGHDRGLINKIFLPFLLYEMTAFFFFNLEQDLNYTFLPIIIQALKIPPIFTKYLLFISKAGRDLMIYFFSFICFYNTFLIIF